MLKLKIWGQCIQQKCTAYLLAENGTFDFCFFSHSILIARVLVFYTGFFILLFIWKDIRPFSMNCDPRTINPPTSKKKGSCIENTWSKIEFLREKKGKAALTQNLTSHTNSMINLAQCDWKEQIYLKDHNFDLALNL